MAIYEQMSRRRRGTRTENPQVSFVAEGREGILQVAPEVDEGESCRQVALLIHHETCTGGNCCDETHDRVQPLQADGIDDEARAQTHKDAREGLNKHLVTLQLGVHVLVILHFLHCHAINRDIVPDYNTHTHTRHTSFLEVIVSHPHRRVLALRIWIK